MVDWGIILAKGKLATTNHDSAPRLQRSLFANPTLGGTKDEHFSFFQRSCKIGLRDAVKSSWSLSKASRGE